MILLAECRDGFGNATFFDWFGYAGCGELESALRKRYEINGQTAWSLKEKAERFRVILVSQLARQEVATMGMIPAETLPQALELARVKKTIGHSLDAAVAIKATGDTAELLREFEGELAGIFIVSKATLADELSGETYCSEGGEALEILVTAAPGEKCERCWCYDEEIGGDAEHPTLCPKCLVAVK